jgi:hypothetical protein
MWTNWNQRPEYIPEDPCLVKPEFIHTKPTDILGVLYPEDYLKIIASNQYMNVQYLVPNHTAFSQLMMYLDNAQTLAGKETDSIYRFRIDLVRDVISGFDTQNRIYEVFGYLNSGGLYKYHMYQYDDAVSCSVAKGLGRGDCFWLKPLGVKQLVKVGDYAQVDVKVSYGTDIIGQATYQAGPGLYQAKDQTSPCAVKGTHSLTFLIGNQGSDTIGPRQIIVTDHNDGYATRQIRTVPNVWDYGQYVTLKVDYVSAINGKHTYRYSYKSGSNWESLGTLEFTEQLPYLAPQFFFSTVANESVNYPLIDWAQFKNFSFGSNK